MSDEEQMDKVLSGNTDAFRYFVEKYKDMAFNLAVSIVKDDYHAEEVVQDAFLKAFNGLKSFKRTAKFKSWFYRIIVNEAFQKVKKLKKNHGWLALSEVQEPKQARVSDGEGSQLDQIRKAMKVLAVNESLVLNLFYLEEYSLKEVETITGWSSSKTKVTLHRARKNLRELVTITK